jgi:hypothetical protein
MLNRTMGLVAPLLLAGFLTPGAADAEKTLPFSVGERLTFSIRYGIIKAGTATMEVARDGEGVLRIVSRAHSNSFFDVFFKVRDEIVAWVDPESLQTLRFQKNLNEGKYRKREQVDYLWDRGVARYTDGTEVELAPDARDVLTSFYYLRTLRLPIGLTVPMTYHSSKKNYPVEVDIHKVEWVETPAGRFRCFLIEPYLQTVGVFNQQGRLLVWITADERRMPVKLESKVTFGAFEAILIDYETGRRG